MPFMLEQPYRPVTPAFVSFAGGFNANQAHDLTSLHGEESVHVGSCYPGHSCNFHRTFVRWMKENAWVYRTFQDYVSRIRKHAYPFTYAGFMDPVELLRFEGDEDGHCDWLMYAGSDSKSARKLTLIFELSSPNSYEGGEIEVWGPTGVKRVTERPLGSVTCFPAYAVHRIAPVTRGTRWCLMGHLYGPPFV